MALYGGLPVIINNYIEEGVIAPFRYVEENGLKYPALIERGSRYKPVGFFMHQETYKELCTWCGMNGVEEENANV